MPGADGSRSGGGSGRRGDAAAESSSVAWRDRAARGATARGAISGGTRTGTRPRAPGTSLTCAAWVGAGRAREADSHRQSTVPGVVWNAIPGPDGDRSPLAAAVVVPDAEPVQIARDMHRRARRHDLPAVGAGAPPPRSSGSARRSLERTGGALDRLIALNSPTDAERRVAVLLTELAHGGSRGTSPVTRPDG
jgi:hypothetical protein